MTTNKPEIACWGSFYKGVMQDFGYNEEAARLAAKIDFPGRKISIEPLVRLSDYERLQAECEKLRKLVSECADYLSHNEHTYINHGSVLHSKLIDAAMQASPST